MKSRRPPTLVRRVLLALALAVGLAWLAILVQSYVQVQGELRTNSGLQQFGRELSDGLAAVQRDDVAANVVQTFAQVANGLRARAGVLPGALLFQLRDRAGRELYASPGLGGQSLAGDPQRVVDVTLQGGPYWLYEGRSGKWSLWIAEPHVQTGAMLRLLNGDLVVPFLIASPIVLLTAWLAVSRGLAPLRILGQRIERRPAGDLSALGVAPRYRELMPLVSALDGLLGQLRARVERERAFVQDAAHELRTPMAVIRTQAHVLAHSPGQLERQAALEQLDHAVGRGSHLVQQLLDLATLDAAADPPRETVDMADLTRRHLAQVAPEAAARAVEIGLDSPDSIYVPLAVAPFESILRNLLDNAIKYVGPGGKVQVSLRRSDSHLVLVVADDGPGIAPAQREMVFERFHRGANQAERGAGLGLAIVRQACRRLGAQVTLGTPPSGRGCQFEVCLPVPGDAVAAR